MASPAPLNQFHFPCRQSPQDLAEAMAVPPSEKAARREEEKEIAEGEIVTVLHKGLSSLAVLGADWTHQGSTPAKPRAILTELLIGAVLLPRDIARVLVVLCLLGPRLAVSLDPRKLAKHGVSLEAMAKTIQPLLLTLLTLPSITANSLGATYPEVSLVLVGSGADSVGANLTALPWCEDVRARIEEHVTRTLAGGKPQSEEATASGRSRGRSRGQTRWWFTRVARQSPCSSNASQA